MAWNNSAMEALFNQYGDRINSISLNNGKYLLIGYNSNGVLRENISFKTFNGVDLMVVKHKQNQGGKMIEWEDYITTEFVEGIDILSENNVDDRIDPLILK